MINVNLYPVSVIGVGKCLPKSVITNDDLSKLVDTNDEWITSRTGIKERRVVSGDETCVSLATKAANDAIAFAGINPDEIDLIIFASSMPDNLYPAAACELQKAIDAPNAACFDLSAACTGSVFALTTAKQFINTGAAKTALVVGADLNSRHVDWNDRSTCILFGDGAGAVILQRSKDDVNEILATDMRSDGYKGDNLIASVGGENCPLVEPKTEEDHKYIYMNGREIYRFATKTVPESVVKVLEESNISVEELNHLVLHQANIRIVDAFSQRLGVAKEKIVVNLDKYGNTSAASLLIALTEVVESGKVKTDDSLALCGFGAGLTWGSAVIKWRAKDNRK